MVSDEQQIANLVYRYAEFIDLGDYDGLGSLFEHAVVTTDASDDVRHGAEAMTQQMTEWTKKHANGTPRTRHVTSNLIIEVEGDAATCRSYYTVFQQTEKVPLQPIISGRYHDEFQRLDGVWCFTKRHYINELFGNLSDHLLLDVPPQ
jgi:3-phenylpropionate/cinnamic acid dioxygenase small subunit